jgi:DNA-binding NarL/FixJ family response regulator
MAEADRLRQASAAAIFRILAGDFSDLSDEATDRLLKRLGKAPLVSSLAAIPDTRLGRRSERLTNQELEVVKGISHGLGNAEIAEVFGISTETVKTHVRHVLSALRAKNRAHAVAIAIREGLIP